MISHSILIWVKFFDGSLTRFIFPDKSPKANEYAKFIGTFEGAMCRTFPLPTILSLAIYERDSLFKLAFRHQNPNVTKSV